MLSSCCCPLGLQSTCGKWQQFSGSLPCWGNPGTSIFPGHICLGLLLSQKVSIVTESSTVYVILWFWLISMFIFRVYIDLTNLITDFVSSRHLSLFLLVECSLLSLTLLIHPCFKVRLYTVYKQDMQASVHLHVYYITVPYTLGFCECAPKQLLFMLLTCTHWKLNVLTHVDVASPVNDQANQQLVHRPDRSIWLQHTYYCVFVYTRTAKMIHRSNKHVNFTTYLSIILSF